MFNSEQKCSFPPIGRRYVAEFCRYGVKLYPINQSINQSNHLLFGYQRHPGSWDFFSFFLFLEGGGVVGQFLCYIPAEKIMLKKKTTPGCNKMFPCYNTQTSIILDADGDSFLTVG